MKEIILPNKVISSVAEMIISKKFRSSISVEVPSVKTPGKKYIKQIDVLLVSNDQKSCFISFKNKCFYFMVDISSGKMEYEFICPEEDFSSDPDAFINNLFDSEIISTSFLELSQEDIGIEEYILGVSSECKNNNQKASKIINHEKFIMKVFNMMEKGSKVDISSEDKRIMIFRFREKAKEMLNVAGF